jgi:lipopolysaccharide transport system ATP-binding protein
MSSDEVVIDVRGLSKRYDIYATPRDRLKQMLIPPLALALGRAEPRFYREFWALRDVSFQVRRGESLGIIGRNGSGKSTLLQIIAGTVSPTSGELTTRGRMAALLELGSGFNPEFTGRENVQLSCAILGMSRAETERRMEAILEFADIGDFVDQPVKTYSSGMFVRLAFAVQAHIDAGVVLIDEALAVGDVFFRQKCYGRLEALRAEGAAIVLVSHSMPDVEEFCERAVLLEQGGALFLGPASEAAKRYYLVHQGEGQLATAPGAKPAQAQSRPLAAAAGATAWRPARAAYLDISRVPQVSNGAARCVAVALSDANGDPCVAFRQGDTAVIHYEFEILEDIGVPIGGVVLRSEKGVIVHGKNSWQFDQVEAAVAASGARVLFSQEIVLDLAVGEYVFEVGLAAVAEKDWKRRVSIPYAEMNARVARICHVPDIGPFSVSLAMKSGVSVLLHHGVANLPGRMRVDVETPGMPREAEAAQ